MKKFLLLTILSFIISASYSQTPVVVWDHNFGGSKSDFAYSMSKTFDGGFIIGGESFSLDSDTVSRALVILILRDMD